MPFPRIAPTVVGLLGTLLFLAPASLAAEATDEEPGLRAEIEAAAAEEDLTLIEETIAEAIAHGALIYNLGNHDGMEPEARMFFRSSCFKIYEGTAYKLVVELEDRVPAATEALRAALEETAENEDPDRNAWTMRRCFDAILGEETVGAPPEEDEDAPEGGDGGPGGIPTL